MTRRHLTLLLAVPLLAALVSTGPLRGAEKRVKVPTLEEVGDGTRRLLLPDDVTTFLAKEFPNNRMPREDEFSPEMMKYYFSRLIGPFPAVAYGDFNGDRKRDYIFLLVTGETKWGPLCELVVINGKKRTYEAHRLGEVYNIKEDYVSFAGDKLIKGRYKKGAWYINWDKKKNLYVVTKS